MGTPKDKQRIAAFRAWLKHIGSIEAARAATGINTRSLQRMRAGKKPPPVTLLQDLMRSVADTNEALAEQLYYASGVFIDEAATITPEAWAALAQRVETTNA